MHDLRALLAAVQGAQMAVLVGDQKQLPPTVKTQRAAELGLEAPLFSRLIAMGMQPHLLDVQYRMHPAISQFPSEAFYRGLLRNGISPQQRVPPAGFRWPDPSRPVAFLECRCDLHGASQVSVAGLLASAGYMTFDFGLLKPFCPCLNTRNVNERCPAYRSSHSCRQRTSCMRAAGTSE